MSVSLSEWLSTCLSVSLPLWMSVSISLSHYSSPYHPPPLLSFQPSVINIRFLAFNDLCFTTMKSLPPPRPLFLTNARYDAWLLAVRACSVCPVDLLWLRNDVCLRVHSGGHISRQVGRTTDTPISRQVGRTARYTNQQTGRENNTIHQSADR